jgi:hypothetical protein
MNLDLIHSELYEICLIAAAAMKATATGNTEAPDLYCTCCGLVEHLDRRHPGGIAISAITKQTLERLAQPPVTISYN